MSERFFNLKSSIYFVDDFTKISIPCNDCFFSTTCEIYNASLDPSIGISGSVRPISYVNRCEKLDDYFAKVEEVYKERNSKREEIIEGIEEMMSDDFNS